jgi:hypothetical protein
VAVRPFDALPPDAAAVVSAGKARPDVYAVPPGAAVRVDVSKLPRPAQADAQVALADRLVDAGYRVDAGAEAVLAASLDPPAAKTTAFPKVKNVPYTHQPLRLQLWAEGKVVLSRAEAKALPATLTLNGNETLAAKAAAEGWGQPNYDALKALRVPPYIPGAGFPHEGFGATELTPDGPQYRGGRTTAGR